MFVYLSRIIKHIFHTWVFPFFPIHTMLQAAGRFPRYFLDWQKYATLPEAETLHIKNALPQLFDATASTSFDAHYFYQAAWAMERIANLGRHQHVDIGSEVKFVSLLSTHLPTVFLDFRPLRAKLPQFTCLAGDILHLPLQSDSVESLSCLHVIEHIGLGRYGDSLNPSGTQQACAELERVLAPGGSLFLSTPIGRQRTCFNSHRICSPSQVLKIFRSVEIVEFSVVDDHHQMRINVQPEDYENAHHACGLFWLRRT